MLSTYESRLSKREGLDCLRRSHDIKVIILGADHPDCLAIKLKINELVHENAFKQARKNSSSFTNHEQYASTRNNSSIFRPSTTSIKNFVEVSPKAELEKCLQEIKKQTENATSPKNDEFNRWLKKNSIIELIPSKLDKEVKRASSEQSRTILESQFDFVKSEDDEFVKSFAYKGENNENEKTETDSVTPTSSKPFKKQSLPEKSILVKSKTNEAITAKLKFSKSQSASNARLAEQQKSYHSIHSRHCKCPTAVSIDVHNSKTINGPHSCLGSLMNNNKTQNVQTKILKRIYYK